MNYKILNSKLISVVSMKGDITKQDKEALSSCSKELKEKRTKSVLILFKNVVTIHANIFRELVLLQHELRQNGAAIRIVGLTHDLKVELASRGVIRENEIDSNLNDAVKKLNRPRPKPWEY